MHAPVVYDSSVLTREAAGLYAAARWTTAKLTLSTAGLFGVLALSWAAISPASLPASRMLVVLAAVGIGAALGLSTGRQRAFALKVRAQTILCQVSIETNTARRIGSGDRGIVRDSLTTVG